jgi:hypothetical protein
VEQVEGDMKDLLLDCEDCVARGAGHTLGAQSGCRESSEVSP